jgi:all-trans-retinol 13,14-reductase
MLVLVSIAALVLAVLAYLRLARPQKPVGANPFAKDTRRPPAPLVTDFETRHQRLKKIYSRDSVPQNLDAIVIGRCVCLTESQFISSFSCLDLHTAALVG